MRINTGSPCLLCVARVDLEVWKEIPGNTHAKKQRYDNENKNEGQKENRCAYGAGRDAAPEHITSFGTKAMGWEVGVRRPSRENENMLAVRTRTRTSRKKNGTKNENEYKNENYANKKIATKAKTETDCMNIVTQPLST